MDELFLKIKGTCGSHALLHDFADHPWYVFLLTGVSSSPFLHLTLLRFCPPPQPVSRSTSTPWVWCSTRSVTWAPCWSGCTVRGRCATTSETRWRALTGWPPLSGTVVAGGAKLEELPIGVENFRNSEEAQIRFGLQSVDNIFFDTFWAGD